MVDQSELDAMHAAADKANKAADAHGAAVKAVNEAREAEVEALDAANEAYGEYLKIQRRVYNAMFPQVSCPTGLESL